MAALVFAELKRRAGTDHLLAPYMHTPTQVIPEFIEFGGFQPSHRCVEIGCGDGRLMRALAEKVGCNITGFEVDEEALTHAHAHLGEMSPDARDLLTLHELDAMCSEASARCDWSSVDICYVYLTKAGLRQVFPQLKQKMRAGSSFVTIQYSVDGVEPIAQGSTSFLDSRGETMAFNFFHYAIE
eukprot:gb/GFBE01014828.1/.p1 GENE.gb/GFBE01014828.1/~~gb/GFBE01014828.1/.p1  ORF type:complete len:184 (+),score=27.79 gb/GFBE01014828.1/:1-552(+)